MRAFEHFGYGCGGFLLQQSRPSTHTHNSHSCVARTVETNAVHGRPITRLHCVHNKIYMLFSTCDSGAGLFRSIRERVSETECAPRPTQIRAPKFVYHILLTSNRCAAYSRHTHTFTDLMQIHGRCHTLLKDMPDK